MKNEPVVTVALITALITSLLAVVTSFGIPLTEDQQTAITGFIIAGVAVGGAFIARRYVTPVAKAEAAQAVAVDVAVAEVVDAYEGYEPEAATPRRALIEDDNG